MYTSLQYYHSQQSSANIAAVVTDELYLCKLHTLMLWHYTEGIQLYIDMIYNNTSLFQK